MSEEQILERMAALGLRQSELPLDELSSATSALLCFPMYMVSNVHGWTADRQFVIPLLRVHGLEAIRESFVIGAEKAELRIDKAHEKVLDSFLAESRPSDRLVYEHAIETLRMFLAVAREDLATAIRTRVAQMMVRVAKAAGEKLFGSGDPVSTEERECIATIARALDLHGSSEASSVLAEIGVAA